MPRARILMVAIVFGSLWTVLSAGTTPGSLTDEVRVVGLVMLPTVIAASLLVLYFDWRGKLRRRILAERDAQRDRRVGLDKAA